METIKLNGTRLARRGKAMELLGRVLDLPEWWGRNLDALYDCLTEPCCRVRLELSHREAMEQTGFGRRLLRVLEDAAEENPGLEVTWVQDEEI